MVILNSFLYVYQRVTMDGLVPKALPLEAAGRGEAQ